MPIGVLGAAAILGAGLLSLEGQRQRAKQEGRGIDAQIADEKRRRADIKAALGPEADRAQERLEDDESYTLSDTREQELIDADLRDVKTQQKDALAEIVRGSDGDPLRAGRRMQLMRSIVGQGAGELGRRRLESRRMAEQIGQQRRAQDIGTVSTLGGALGGIQSQAPAMMFQSTPMSARAADVAGDTLTAFASQGAFDKPEPSTKGALGYD
tara:strand:+ start:1323 stop:1958 length:636 start_codon:yes stop_codon:yes gene_type:complete